jgi:hypothetical protein
VLELAQVGGHGPVYGQQTLDRAGWDAKGRGARSSSKEGVAMSDQPPSHQDIERYCRELPKSIIARLPNSIEKREAERLVDVLAD